MTDLFQQYQRKTFGELRPYVVGEDMAHITVNPDDAVKYGCPKEGDMVARDPKDRDNMWLVSKEYFANNFMAEPMAAIPPLVHARVSAEQQTLTSTEQDILDKRLGKTQAAKPDALTGNKRSEF